MNGSAESVSQGDNRQATAPTLQIAPAPASNSAQETAQVWDKAGALRRVRGRRERLRLLIQRYTEQSPELIADIFQAVESQDLTQAAQLCHTLLGVAANLGALALVNNTQALEQACKNNACEQARQRAGELLVLNDQFVTVIRDFDAPEKRATASKLTR